LNPEFTKKVQSKQRPDFLVKFELMLVNLSRTDCWETEFLH